MTDTPAEPSPSREDDYKRERAWGQTEIGKLFFRFEAALGRAWVTDCREFASDAAMKRDWEAANVARRELLKVLRGW
jgi:hypothetical protein